MIAYNDPKNPLISPKVFIFLFITYLVFIYGLCINNTKGVIRNRKSKKEFNLYISDFDSKIIHLQ
jgi:hypothetical protein